MNAIDRRKNDLLAYNPQATIGADELDNYWENTLSGYAERPLAITRETVATPFPAIIAERLSYKGSDDTLIHGLYILPQQRIAGEKLPVSSFIRAIQGIKGFRSGMRHGCCLVMLFLRLMRAVKAGKLAIY